MDIGRENGMDDHGIHLDNTDKTPAALPQ